MAADSFATRKFGSVFRGGFKKIREPVYIAEAGQYPGFIFSLRNGNSDAYLFNQADYSGSAYMATGILDCKPGHAIDTVYTVGDFCEYFAIGDDVDVAIYVINATPAPSYNIGDIIVASTTDGYGQKWATGLLNTSYDYLASPLCKIGKVSMEMRAGSTSDAKIITVNLSG